MTYIHVGNLVLACVGKDVHGLDAWRVVLDYWASLPGGDQIYIPAGFETNLASIPRLLWPVIGHPAQAEFVEAATVHDWLCVVAERTGSYAARVYGDGVFRWLLSQNRNVGRCREIAMYLAVRFNGWWTFRGRQRPARN